MEPRDDDLIREAECRAVEDAGEVERLRAEVAGLRRRLDEAIEDPPRRGRISYRGSNGRWYDDEREARSQYTFSEGGRENP